MGACGSKSTRTLEVAGGAMTKQPNAAASGRGNLREKSEEGGERSLAGNLMQTHQEGDALRIEDEYDSYDAKVLGSGIEGSVDGGRMPQAQRAWVLEQVRLADEGKPSVFPKDRSETIIIACSDGSSAEVTRLTLESLGYTTACNAGSWARYEASRGAKQ